MSAGFSRAEAELFVLSLGRALHRYGAPAHRLESALVEVSSALSLQASFFSTPTAFFATFDVAGERSTFLERLEPSEVDLGKLGDVDALARAVRERVIDPVAAALRLEEIQGRAPLHRPPAQVLAGAALSAAAALLFGGAWREAAIAALAGALVGVLGIALAQRPNMRPLQEVLGAVLVSMLAIGLGGVLGVPSTIATLAGLILMVPGLTLTRACTELAQRSLVSGTSRLFGALLTFLMLGFGVVLGTRLGTLAFGPPGATVGAALPAWGAPLAAAVSAWGFWMLLGAARRDLPWIVLGGVASFQIARFAAPPLGVELAAFLGALTVGVGSNVYARLLRRPAMIPRVPSLLMLVPGALGYRSVAALASTDAIGGVQSAFTVAIVAIALVTGLLASSAIVAPRTEL